MLNFIKAQIVYVLLALLVSAFIAFLVFYLFSYKPLEIELETSKKEATKFKKGLFLAVETCRNTTFETKYKFKIPTYKEYTYEENDTSISFFDIFNTTGMQFHPQRKD